MTYSPIYLPSSRLLLSPDFLLSYVKTQLSSNLENRKIHRFAIEYNGVYYHSKKRDLQKESKATQKGWHYLEVNDLPRYSNSRELFDRKIHEICKTISDTVINREIE